MSSVDGVQGSAAVSPAGVRACYECSQPFQSPYHWQKYCSPKCADHNSNRNRGDAGDGALPPDEESVAYELTYMYAVTCLLCGRRQCEDVRMTREQAGRYALVGLRPCSACRGSVFLDQLDAGQIGSLRMVKYSQTANVAVRWGPSVR